MKADQFDRMIGSVRSAAVIAFLGLCACGFIVGAFIAFAPQPWMVGGMPVLGVVGIAGAAALFGATFTWYLFGGRFHKIRLTQFLKRPPRSG